MLRVMDWLMVGLVAGVGVVLAVLVMVRTRRVEDTGQAALDESLKRLEASQRDEAERLRKVVDEQAAAGRKEQAETLERFADRLQKTEEARQQAEAALREALQKQFKEQDIAHRADADKLRALVQERLETLQVSNEQRLTQMQKTVDEKLQSALERKLTESFGQVRKQLESVHQGLGEMQKLAEGVGDLKRVMTNVKKRGTWGEYVLGNLLEQVLTPQQYEANCKVRKRSDNRVEFAIRMPGSEEGRHVWLPIDSKFPKEDFERLEEAAAAADPTGVETARKALATSVLGFARDIRNKYIAPPETTDFGVLFVPTEGLFAELLRQPGLLDKLQRECKVTLAGPTTMLALLNSLQMGFHTLEIQKKSTEVWKVLGQVKGEFGRFEGWIAGVQKKIDEAGKVLEKDLGVRTRQMLRALDRIEALPEGEGKSEE